MCGHTFELEIAIFPGSLENILDYFGFIYKASLKQSLPTVAPHTRKSGLFLFHLV